MGIPENPAKHALYKTGNNSADMAVAWYFENMDDASIQAPLKIKKEAAGGGGDVSAANVEQLMGMGFTEKKCKKALRECDNNVERAMEWIFSHMDEPDSDGDSEM